MTMRKLSTFDTEDFLESHRGLTVKQIIELLTKQPPDAKVILEGCDCYGLANAVSISEESQCLVIIER